MLITIDRVMHIHGIILNLYFFIILIYLLWYNMLTTKCIAFRCGNRIGSITRPVGPWLGGSPTSNYKGNWRLPSMSLLPLRWTQINHLRGSELLSPPWGLYFSDLSDVVSDLRLIMSTFSGDETAPFFGFLGAAAALVFSCNSITSPNFN